MPAMKNPLLVAPVLLLALAGCPKQRPSPSEAADGGARSVTRNRPMKSEPTRTPDAGGDDATACVDAWLRARRLDPYGHPEGTMYMGGTPLFDERTGETTDRLHYVAARHPEVRAACGLPPTDAGHSEGGPGVK